MENPIVLDGRTAFAAWYFGVVGGIVKHYQFDMFIDIHSITEKFVEMQMVANDDKKPFRFKIFARETGTHLLMDDEIAYDELYLKHNDHAWFVSVAVGDPYCEKITISKFK